MSFIQSVFLGGCGGIQAFTLVLLAKMKKVLGCVDNELSHIMLGVVAL